MKRSLTPVFQLSFGVMAFTISLIFIAYSLRIIPDEDRQAIEARTKISENLAIQLANLASKNDTSSIRETISSIIGRDPDIVSIGIRGSDGQLIVSSLGHNDSPRPPDGKSTTTYLQVPLLDADVAKGSIEIVFQPLFSSISNFAGLSRTMLEFIGLMIVVGFSGYYFILGRALRELDPSRAIPQRVAAAFDTLAEGVLIIDEKESVLLANEAFSRNIQASTNPIIGININDLPWSTSIEDRHDHHLPWRRALQDQTPVLGVPMTLETPSGEARKLLVNATRIADEDGETRGIIATFDDVTLLHETNAQLSLSMDQLRRSQTTITEQNLQLKVLASNDPLTGCLNRRAFFDDVEGRFRDARDRCRPVSFLMFDADHFKSINDRFGHATGDKVLIGLVRILKDTCHDKGPVGRYGGEEFCLAIAGFAETDVEKLADQIRLAIAGVSTWLPNGERVTVSIGMAFSQDGAGEITELVKRADEALYHAKSTGRNRVINWSKIPPSEEPSNVVVEKLRATVKAGSFRCAFQPKVDIRNRRVVGFEALVRLPDDDDQLYPPSEFIGLAVKADVIKELTYCVLDIAIASMHCLDESFGPDTTMSVNVAAKLINDSEFMIPFIHRLHQSGMAERFILELTEESFIEKGIFQAEIVPVLRGLGIRISIDDFGTGYSSLSALADITANELKIDRSFVFDIHTRPRNQSILQAIGSLGSALGMSVVAEGVETFEELTYLLAATNIRIVQGFYFSKPFFLEDIESVSKLFLSKESKPSNAIEGNKQAAL